MLESELFIDATRPPLKGDKGVIHSMDSYFNRSDYFEGFGMEVPNPPDTEVKVLNDPEDKFEIKFDKNRYKKLLSFVGLTDEEIKKVKLTVGDDRLIDGILNLIAGASTSPTTKEVEIPIGRGIKFAQRNARKLESQIENQSKWKVKYNGINLSEETITSLRRLDSETRSKAIQAKSIEDLSQRLNETLLHESKHLTLGKNAFLQKGSFWAGVSTGSILAFNVLIIDTRLSDIIEKPILIASAPVVFVATGVTMYIASYGIFHSWEPVERSANKFAEKYRDEERWQNIIKIVPKAENSDTEADSFSRS